MVIKSLVDLYERLIEQKLVAPPNWDKQKISYVIVLREDGSIKELKDVREKVQRGKRELLVARYMVLPKAVIRTGNVKANFLWDNSTYVFGYNPKDPARASLCFERMRKKHHLVLDNVPDKEAKAILAFFDTWQPCDVDTDPVIRANKEVLEGPYNFAFCLEGETLSSIADNPLIQKAWQNYLEESSSSSDVVYGTCSVTGKTHQRIAVLHPKIKGIVGADPSGASLVCFNVKSVCSYGHDGEQAVNSSVSEYAVMAYTKALNWLLSQDNHRTTINNVTVVYWSENNNAEYGKAFETYLNQSSQTDEETSNLNDIISGIKRGNAIDFETDSLNPGETFCVLGLGSSGSRASVRFFMKDTFGNILTNLIKHQMRLTVERPSNVTTIPLWLLLKVSSKPKAEIPSQEIDALFRSILYNQPYPPALYTNMLHRVFMESDSTTGKEKTSKVNYIKTGMIKAYLIQNCKGWEALDSVALNEDFDNKSYLLGRLFALLEGIQKKALPTINSTIKDRYFNSACATPGIVFPTLIKLSHAHRKKLNRGLALYFDKKESDLIDRITVGAGQEGFPKRLTPEEQGVFILGYYQGRQAVFNKNKDNEEKVEE